MLGIHVGLRNTLSNFCCTLSYLHLQISHRLSGLETFDENKHQFVITFVVIERYFQLYHPGTDTISFLTCYDHPVYTFQHVVVDVTVFLSLVSCIFQFTVYSTTCITVTSSIAVGCVLCLAACAPGCVFCDTNGAGLCDVCETGYLLDTTTFTCLSQFPICICNVSLFYAIFLLKLVLELYPRNIFVRIKFDKKQMDIFFIRTCTFH